MKSFFSFFQRRPKRNTHILHFRETTLKQPKRIIKTRFVVNHARKYKVFTIAVVCIAIAFIVFISPVFQIQKVEAIRKNLSIDTAEIETWVLGKSIGKNILFLSLSDMNDALAQEFPQWKSIHVKKKFPHTLYVEVENFKAYAYIILKREVTEDKVKKQTSTTKTPQKTRATIIQEEKYVINERGNITYPDVGEIPSLSIRYNDSIKDQVVAGKNIIPAEFVQKIDMITKKLLKEHELAAKEVIYFPAGKEIHVNLYQFSLWFDLLQDIDGQLRKFSKSLTFLDKNKIEYIDLRINNRVIYKEKNERTRSNH